MSRQSERQTPDEQELTDDEVRFFRSISTSVGHLKWLWRTIIKPVLVTAAAMLVGAPALISGIKELLKLWSGHP